MATTENRPVQVVYRPEDIQPYVAPAPGEFPYRGGIHQRGYAERLWTKRQFAGFGDAEDTNNRFKNLLAAGQTGLSLAFDMPTLYGYDTDAPEAEGEFGTCGVACCSVRDMEKIFDGIPLDSVSVSMTINSPAAPIWAMFIAAAERQGVSREKLQGTLQNDILKEYIAQKEYIFPPEPSMRLVVDTVEYATKEMPKWNPISVSGYHIREAGSTPAQELAFTLADGFAYVEACMERGMPVDSFAPRLSFFFNSAFPQGNATMYDEIAKFRAAREIWAERMKQRYKAENERSLKLRFHAQTSGASLTPQDPLNNLTRSGYQALAAAFGGAQSMHVDAYDEALAVPTAEAARLALNQQHVLSDETGIDTVVDPWAGSYFMEALTNRMKKDALAYIDAIGTMGGGSMHHGVLRGIENAYMEREIANAASEYQRTVESGKQRIVGVNVYQHESGSAPPALKIDQESCDRHMTRLQALRNERDTDAVQVALTAVEQACRKKENVMPYLVAAAHAEATLGEMMGVMKTVFGEYQASGSF